MAGSIKAVIDASFILAYLLPDENIPEVEETIKKFRQSEIDLLSSEILPFEVFNCIRTAVIRKRISAALADKLGQTFLEMDIFLEGIDYGKTLSLAVTKSLSFYDASYVWLSKSKNLQLLSLDRRMKKLANK